MVEGSSPFAGAFCSQQSLLYLFTIHKGERSHQHLNLLVNIKDLLFLTIEYYIVDDIITIISCFPDGW